MEKWFIKNRQADYKKIAATFGISEVLARLCVNRGINSKEELSAYLNPSIEQLHSPFLLKDIEKAVQLIITKINDQAKIRIVGDYDVDGVMATYILYTGLTKISAIVDYEIPERIKDGYGININIIEQAKKDYIDTIITCDNGIAALEQVKRAKELNMTVIITDHHDIAFLEEYGVRSYMVPEADAVVNPKQEDCHYPFEGICGAVVAYKLVEALYQTLGRQKDDIEELLEFAAIATVCDVMDLVNENRAIVKFGLQKINMTKNPGLQSLLMETGIADKKISVYHLGFIIGPCINASGRLESAKLSLSLFLTNDKAQAVSKARQLKLLNDERKEMTQAGLDEAIEYLEQSEHSNDKVLLVYLPNCHESLAGIIAGRVKERYHKPTIVLTDAHVGVKGSARSIEEYNMFEELNKCKTLLLKFGGHPMAAGLSLEKVNIEPLRHLLNENTVLTEEDLLLKVSFDMVLELDQISMPLIYEIEKLEPYGKGNNKPLFVLKDVTVVKANVLGKNKNVLKLQVTKGNRNQRYTAMIFQGVLEFEQCIIHKYSEEELQKVYSGVSNEVLLDIVFYPDINEFNGVQTLQIMIQHYR